MCSLAELGPGFHLVPVRDTNRVTVAPGKPRESDWRRVNGVKWSIFESVPGSWGAPDWQRAVNARIDSEMQAVIRARLDRSANRKAKLAERKRQCALDVCDPMAVQAAAILRAVLRDLREGGE